MFKFEPFPLCSSLPMQETPGQPPDKVHKHVSIVLYIIEKQVTAVNYHYPAWLQ